MYKCLLASLNDPVGNGLSGIHAEASSGPEFVWFLEKTNLKIQLKIQAPDTEVR